MSTNIKPIYQQTLRGGASFAWQLKRGYRMTFTDKQGGGNLACMLHSLDRSTERYNMPDSLKGQHTSHLTKGHCLHSDMGRILASIVEDDLGWHDPIAGFSNASQVERKFGKKSFQQARNNWYRNSYDHFVIELGKYGLGVADLTASVNLFSKVECQLDGSMNFIAGHSPAGTSVTVRADMPILVTMSALQHPMDPNSEYDPKPIDLAIYAGEPASDDDVCRNSCSENQRAMEITDYLFA